MFEVLSVGLVSLQKEIDNTSTEAQATRKLKTIEPKPFDGRREAVEVDSVLWHIEGT